MISKGPSSPSHMTLPEIIGNTNQSKGEAQELKTTLKPLNSTVPASLLKFEIV